MEHITLNINYLDRYIYSKAIILFVLLSIIFFLPSWNLNDTVFNSKLPEDKVRGVCWVGGDSIVSSNLDSLVKNDVQWLSQTPFAWMRGHDNPNLTFDNTRSWWGERDDGLIHTTQLAHEKGIKVMLKPHIWISRANGKWRSDIKMNSKGEWDMWFENYEKMILHYANIAEEADVDALCIGTELLIPTTKHPIKWRSIIRKIRDVYKGELTYAANFYKEYEKIKFWDDLDYIGVQAYFPLSNKNDPNLNTLKKSWKKHAKSLEKIALKYQKKIVFTEIGYKNTIDAAIEPWKWPRQMELEEIIESEDVQANCYEAMFSTLWNKHWFGGVFIWKWFHGNHEHDYAEYQIQSRERRKKRAESRGYKLRPPIDFTPQGKRAERVMSKYYSIK